VRSYHFLKHLASRYRVFLGTFIDDRTTGSTSTACARSVPRSRRGTCPAVEAGAERGGIADGEALSLRYFRSAALQRWVDATVSRERIGRAFAYSSPMAQYILGRPGLRCVVDFVDMDSAKWTDYADAGRGRCRRYSSARARDFSPGSRRLPRVLARRCSSPRTSESLLQGLPGHSGRIVAVRNGVDSDFLASTRVAVALCFRRARRGLHRRDGLLAEHRRGLVVRTEVLPKIREREPGIRFYVVGMKPGAHRPGAGKRPVDGMTGRVPDVRPSSGMRASSSRRFASPAASRTRSSRRWRWRSRWWRPPRPARRSPHDPESKSRWRTSRRFRRPRAHDARSKAGERVGARARACVAATIPGRRAFAHSTAWSTVGPGCRHASPGRRDRPARRMPLELSRR